VDNAVLEIPQTVAKRQNLKLGRKPKMHARPHIREKLIEMKLRRWRWIALDPKYYPGFTAAQARRNFWRLAAKYPDALKKAGLHELSVYP